MSTKNGVFANKNNNKQVRKTSPAGLEMLCSMNVRKHLCSNRSPGVTVSKCFNTYMQQFYGEISWSCCILVINMHTESLTRHIPNKQCGM